MNKHLSKVMEHMQSVLVKSSNHKTVSLKFDPTLCV
jgi:hypothetical protein